MTKGVSQASASGAERSIDPAALEHLWRYFELHANQRFSVFNFYTVLVGFAAAGLGVALQGSTRFTALGIVLGLLIALLSFVFWKLDQRGAMLIKHSEKMLEAIEARAVGAEAAVFSAEPSVFLQAAGGKGLGGLWTFGKSLRLIFLVMGIFGFGGAGLSALRFIELISWEASSESSTSNSAKVPPGVVPEPPPTTKVPERHLAPVK